MEGQLLGWAAKHSDPAKVEELKKNPPKIDPKWLKAIMATEADHVKECMEVWNNPDAGRAAHELALVDLEGLVQNLDTANDLHTLGGFVPMLETIKSDDEEFAVLAADIIATCCQNNPPCQEQFLQLGGMPSLLHLLKSVEKAQLLHSGVSLTSAVLRHSPAICEEFTKQEGWATLMTAIQSKSAKRQTKRKAIFLLTLLVGPEEAGGLSVEGLQHVVDVLSKEDGKALIETLTSLLSEADDDLIEKSLRFVITATGVAGLKPFVKSLDFSACTSHINTHGERDAEYTAELESILKVTMDAIA